MWAQWDMKIVLAGKRNTWEASHQQTNGSTNGSERVNTKNNNSLTPSKNATDIKPAAFSVNGDEENRTLDLLHAMQDTYLPINV
jgi:hypothetical protein